MVIGHANLWGDFGQNLVIAIVAALGQQYTDTQVRKSLPCAAPGLNKSPRHEGIMINLFAFFICTRELGLA